MAGMVWSLGSGWKAEKEKASPNLGNDLLSSVRNKIQREPGLADHMLEEELSSLFGSTGYKRVM